MYPNLSYLLHDIFGTQPDNWASVVATFGLFLIIAIGVAAYFLKLEFIRKEKEGLIGPTEVEETVGLGIQVKDLITNAFWGFFIGFKIIHLFQNQADINDPVEFMFSTQGNTLYGIILAVVFAGIYAYQANKDKLSPPKKIKKLVYPHDRVWDIAVIAGLSGVVGAKFFAVFESVEGAKAFFQNPLEYLLTGSGLAIYGGLILAFIVLFFYVKRKGIKPIHVMDAAAPSLILGYGIGRIGCQLSGDGDWGIVNIKPTPDWWFLPDWMWSYTYPQNVLKQGVKIPDCEWEYCYQLAQGVYPTPLYEIVMSLIIFGILWALRKRIKIPGMLFFIYMIFNGIERFWIEKIRVNDKLPFLGMELTQAEIISVIIFLAGIVGCLIVYNKEKKKVN